jgi:hypothetical protein
MREPMTTLHRDEKAGLFIAVGSDTHHGCLGQNKRGILCWQGVLSGVARDSEGVSGVMNAGRTVVYNSIGVHVSQERKKRYIRDDSLVYRERDGCPLNM